MELTVSSLRFLLNPAALKSVMDLLSLPLFPGMQEITPEEKETGLSWLSENGFLSQNTDEKPTLARELAFMITGLCQEKEALIWQEKGKAVMIACRFRKIYLLCWKMRVGKWEIAPFAEKDAFQKELDEQLPGLDKAQLFHRAKEENLPNGQSSDQCLQWLHLNEEA